MAEYDGQIAEEAASRALRYIYSVLVPKGSITFAQFIQQLLTQIKTDPESKEVVSKCITDEYLGLIAKKTGDKNAVFGAMFDGLVKRDVSKSVPSSSQDILELPKVGRTKAKAFPW